MPPDAVQGMPRVELRDPSAFQVELLRGLQRALLTHPVAAQAIFTALLAEGRRFAGTQEGRLWIERLRSSALLQQVRHVFDLSTLNLLEEEPAGTLPSGYLDALFMVAAGGEGDALLDRLFWGGAEEKPHVEPGE